jgi:hypothetical protein
LKLNWGVSVAGVRHPTSGRWELVVEILPWTFIGVKNLMSEMHFWQLNLGAFKA